MDDDDSEMLYRSTQDSESSYMATPPSTGSRFLDSDKGGMGTFNSKRNFSQEVDNVLDDTRSSPAKKSKLFGLNLPPSSTPKGTSLRVGHARRTSQSPSSHLPFPSVEDADDDDDLPLDSPKVARPFQFTTPKYSRQYVPFGKRTKGSTPTKKTAPNDRLSPPVRYDSVSKKPLKLPHIDVKVERTPTPPDELDQYFGVPKLPDNINDSPTNVRQLFDVVKQLPAIIQGMPEQFKSLVRTIARRCDTLEAENRRLRAEVEAIRETLKAEMDGMHKRVAEVERRYTEKMDELLHSNDEIVKLHGPHPATRGGAYGGTRLANPQGPRPNVLRGLAGLNIP